MSRPPPTRPASGASVTALGQDELARLQRELEERLAGAASGKAGARPGRWNADPEDVQRAVAKLVLTLVEFLRRLLERQALRRMESSTLSPEQVEAVGQALMRLEQAVQDLCRHFGIPPDELNLDLGPLGRLIS